jgi:hypothetical protein
MKKSILILTALTGIVTGAFAGGPPTPITQLPALIDQPGKYVLDPSAVAQPDVYTQQPAIQISASNVDLDLNGLQIDCFWGIQVGIGATVVDHVSVSNGTINGNVPNGNFSGLTISGGCTYVSIFNVDTTGSFGAVVEWGNTNSWKNCTFQCPLLIWGNSAVGDSYEHITVTQFNGPDGSLSGLALLDQSLGKPNDFKNLTVISGNVNFKPTDTYKNLFKSSTTQVIGGIASAQGHN